MADVTKENEVLRNDIIELVRTLDELVEATTNIRGISLDGDYCLQSTKKQMKC